MKLIAAVNNNWAIGKGNDLLYDIPSDKKFFRSATKNNIIVIGRKTLESFPGAKPLPYRTNVVLSKNKNYTAENIVLLNTVEDVIKYANEHTEAEVFICGGEEIYRLFLPYCSEALITKIDDVCDAEKFMPNLDRDDNWELADSSESFYEGGYSFRFCTYRNKNQK